MPIPHPTGLGALDQWRAWSTLPGHPIVTVTGGIGISTDCPSPTLFSLGLGPAYPGRTSLPQETLGFRRAGFSPAFSLTHTGILSSVRSTTPYGIASPHTERSPTISVVSRQAAVVRIYRILVNDRVVCLQFHSLLQDRGRSFR